MNIQRRTYIFIEEVRKAGQQEQTVLVYEHLGLW